MCPRRSRRGGSSHVRKRRLTAVQARAYRRGPDRSDHHTYVPEPQRSGSAARLEEERDMTDVAPPGDAKPAGEAAVPPAAGTPAGTADEQRLAEMGYKQELNRGWSSFTNFAISFTIISVLAGTFTAFGFAWTNGGPIAASIGWPILCALILMVGYSMAELTSRYPTAGGPYWWANELGGKGWSWMTGWFNIVGLVGIVASVAYGCAFFLYNLLALYGLNIFGWVFGHKINNNGAFGGSTTSFGFWFLVLPVGFLLTMYTETGYDASAHTAEETRGAAKAAAQGVWRSIFWSALIGWVLLLAFLFAATDEKAVTDAGGAVFGIFNSALDPWAAKLVVLIATVGQFFCGAAGLTSASRTWYAFSRDRGMPGWAIFRRVNRERVPFNAVIAVSVASLVIAIPALFGKNDIPFAFYALTGICTVGLDLAYILPVILRLLRGVL